MHIKNLKKRRLRKVLLFFQFILLGLVILTAFLIFQIDLIPREYIDKNALEQVELSGNFTNIALFGLDTRADEPEEGARSDTIMIASLNNRTGEMRIVSVFRDTLMLQQNGTYDKANAAYAWGGPQQAIAMLNRNLDLDIETYITVNFNSLSAIIDVLGGVDIEMTQEEIYWMNLYSADTAAHVGVPMPEWIDENQPGIHRLDGVQAVSFSRIRFTEGDDFRRTERQREVLDQVVHRMTRANPVQLLRVRDEVIPQMSTNLTTEEVLLQVLNLVRLNMGEMRGFPFDVTTMDAIPGFYGSFVVPVDMSNNVRQLHGFLFGDETYQVTDRAQQISNDISFMTGI
ncbi:MAG: LCP family protein [Lachnospiraceae bacterium]|nr:LCP family protein [Lachnospiraceae bacterium]